VSFAAKEAVVVFDPARVSVEQMVEAVNRLGVTASPK
jgi:copper chaperone CopZ